MCVWNTMKYKHTHTHTTLFQILIGFIYISGNVICAYIIFAYRNWNLSKISFAIHDTWCILYCNIVTRYVITPSRNTFVFEKTMFLSKIMPCSPLRSLSELEIVLCKYMNINGNQLHLVQGVDNSEAWGNLYVPTTISFFSLSPSNLFFHEAYWCNWRSY